MYFELEPCVFIGLFKTPLRTDEPVFSVSWECPVVLTFQIAELRHGAITATGPHLCCASEARAGGHCWELAGAGAAGRAGRAPWHVGQPAATCRGLWCAFVM